MTMPKNIPTEERLKRFKEDYDNRRESILAQKRAKSQDPEWQAQRQAYLDDPAVKAAKAAYNKERYQNDPSLKEKARVRMTARRATKEGRQKSLESLKKWRDAHPDKVRESKRTDRAKYGAARQEQQRLRKIERRKTDSLYKLVGNLRRRLLIAVKGKSEKSAATMRLVGCTRQELRCYLEALFTEGMTWENYGKWHVDHIIPCAAFDLTDPEQQRKCFNFHNLQPLWAPDNHKKGAKVA